MVDDQVVHGVHQLRRRGLRRLAPELVVVASKLKDEVEPSRYEERLLQDGSRWTVFKRYFQPHELVTELGGGEILHLGHYFLVVRSP